MIRVEPAAEPDNFDATVRQPGLKYLAENPGREPRAYWKACKRDLFHAYHGYCAYTTFRINSRNDAVVDHFLPKSRHPDLCYEWSNYRLSSFHINSVKNNAENISDPFTLPDNAFRLTAGMKVEVNAEAFRTEEERRLAQHTIYRLKLNSSELIADRRCMLDAAMELLKNGREKASVVAQVLRHQSRFIYNEAVRMGCVPPVPE